MSSNPDEQILGAATGLGCFGLIAALILVPPLLLPGFVIYRIATISGATTLHPAFQIALAGATIFALWRLGGMLIRAVPAKLAQAVLAVYIAACYTFVVFQRELTTAHSELDLPWVLLAFAVFAFIGWKVGGMLVLKAYRDQLARSRANTSSA